MPTAKAVLLDTHALLWWKAGEDRLSKRAKAVIAQASTLFVSPLSCWEVGMLAGKGRVVLDRPVAEWVADLMAEERLRSAGLSPTGAVRAANLTPLQGDPIDRMLTATAMDLRIPIVTKDRKIADYAAESNLSVIW
ncbi:MAG: type II toxin-antitoxin system VapC family toxin [Sporichthyaceae bacterium]